MAFQRRPPQHRGPISSAGSPTARRNYLLRRVPSRASSHALVTESISSPVQNRPVLLPLHNTRRLPSRSQLDDDPIHKDIGMRQPSHPVQLGAKRKRVVSNNENAHIQGRSTRTKRPRTNNLERRRYSSTSDESESEGSEMELDPPSTRWPGTDDDSEPEVEEVGASDEEHELDSTDDHYLHSATRTQLGRLKKKDLVRLYRSANYPEDPDLLIKGEIIDVIINNREQDDSISVPPSSPPGRTDAASSDYSSDEGNNAGDEETDADSLVPVNSPSALRRRATLHLHDLPKALPRPMKGRSLSLGNVLGHGHVTPAVKRKGSLRINTETTALRPRTSKEYSTNTSAQASSSAQSPPSHRLRSRKVSAPTPVELPTPSSANSRKSKGKSKQVEFSIQTVDVNPSSRRSSNKGKERQRERAEILPEESDLTELDDDEDVQSSKPQPSPRRLRSKDRDTPHTVSGDDDNHDEHLTPVPKRRTKTQQAEAAKAPANILPVRKPPMRKAKGKIQNLKESDTEVSHEEGDDVEDEVDELEEEEGDQEDDEGEGESESGIEVDEEEEEGEDEDEGGEGTTEEEEEVDELVSMTSATPPPSDARRRKTPVRQRLRRRPTADEENEGDDEHEDEAEVAEEFEVEDDDESTIAVEPRRLRNGKIVGDEDAHMEEEEEEEEEEEPGEEEVEEEVEEEAEEEEEEEETEGEGEQIEIDDSEEEVEEATMEDEVDLTVATAKTLVRLKRDDLVRLCESHNLQPVGTKPQLAEALLQWRDRNNNGFSSPSSTGTVRPPSTSRRRRKKQSSGSTLPVLLRSNKVHTDEPRTPIPGKEKEHEELELDLESLGLEDREIPPEKIQKLEKIGSGGFKDVFIGKFKGRRIAISEFRGQLSAMDIKELKLLGGFDHPNIVRFLGVSIPENAKETPVMIVSELCSNGDLFDYIRNVNSPTLHKVLLMMLDIARGLEYLHMRKPSVIHRDCKSSNILITARGTAKIADFGLAKVKQSTRSMVKSLVGTVNWQAPELWTAHPKYNHKVDVFSCAMVYWEMLQWHIQNKKFPWEGMNEHAIYEQVGAKKHRPSIIGLRKQWCPELIDLIETMWAQDPQDRPTMSEVVETLEDLVKKY
ncbi:hypothetical protein FA15DRAFT_663566 [Coprinopsis marcescibilis]|uniref:Protein kinase domain-containing protein n=1 Tax=Coprinopsis marcescibilis TaxID=230819 RepID=A0A5C3LAV6_COPMA|nr:hypothetical protein FA15DRAFT_663566 [Coprinopsis marcescibilis]